MEHTRHLIIGGGLAGLSCANHFGGGAGAVVIERADEPGGLCRTIHRGGFLCDLTGHWLHFRDSELQRWVDSCVPGGLVAVDRRAQIFSRGVRTPYPFQANTFGLPTDVVQQCVLGFFRAREDALGGPARAPENFEEFIRMRLGDGFARHFMVPYNTKLWTVPPRELDAAWCQRFVPVPSPEEVVRGALESGGAGLRMGYNPQLWYPRRGGIGALARQLHSRAPCEVRCGVSLAAVDWRSRRARLSNGASMAYDVLVSTIPLPDLIGLLDDAPERITEASSRLRAVSVTYWDVGLQGANGACDAHWTYFPEPEVPPYRAGSASAVLGSLAPVGYRSLYVEVSHPRGSHVATTDDEILASLRSVGLAGPEEEPVLWHRSTIDCAYAIMDHAYATARDLLLRWLEQQRILSIGRYGAWIYDSMDGALIHGREAAAKAPDLAL